MGGFPAEELLSEGAGGWHAFAGGPDGQEVQGGGERGLVLGTDRGQDRQPVSS